MQNSQHQEPLVSICIPVFNGEKTIAKTIDSILHQTYKNIEIFVVDNCSTDSAQNATAKAQHYATQQEKEQQETYS